MTSGVNKIFKEANNHIQPNGTGNAFKILMIDIMFHF